MRLGLEARGCRPTRGWRNSRRLADSERATWAASPARPANEGRQKGEVVRSNNARFPAPPVRGLMFRQLPSVAPSRGQSQTRPALEGARLKASGARQDLMKSRRPLLWRCFPGLSGRLSSSPGLAIDLESDSLSPGKYPLQGAPPNREGEMNLVCFSDLNWIFPCV